MGASYDILVSAFKGYAREKGRFNNNTDAIIKEKKNMIVIYARYWNASDIIESYKKDGRMVLNITGSYDLVQISLGFEYDTEIMMYKEDNEQAEMEKDRILQWRKTSLIYNSQ